MKKNDIYKSQLLLKPVPIVLIITIISAVGIPPVLGEEPAYDSALIEQQVYSDKTESPLYQIPGREFEHNAQTAAIDALLDEYRRYVTLALNDPFLSCPSQLCLSNIAYINENGCIHVDITLNELHDDSIEHLCNLGLTVEDVVDSINIVQGWLPCSRMAEAAALGCVQKIQLPRYAIFRTGSVLSQGDAILKANQVRTQEPPGPYKGSGVRVGVISNGVDSAQSAIDSGDLPAEGISVDPLHPGSGDEGTAMLEIIHDLAPGADLYFGGVTNATEMVAIIEWLDEVADCNVICDDVGFPLEPWFQDGQVAQAARKSIVNNGKVYCSSAGNSALEHYQGQFNNDGNGLHDFKLGPGTDIGLNFTVRANSQAILVMQWSDPYGASGNDYDLYVFTTDGATQITASTAWQNGNDDPIEFVFVENNTDTDNQFIAVVDKYAGQDRIIEMLVIDPLNQFVDDDATPTDSIYGHPAVEEVFSCASINAGDPGNDTIASYSSHGPSTIMYPNEEIRQTPFISGIDGVSVTGAGGFSNPFFGTSASAPHIAAVSALLLEQTPDVGPTDIRNRLIAGAQERGEAGYDTIFGYGLADALASVNAGFLTVNTNVGLGGTLNVDGQFKLVVGNDLVLSAAPESGLLVDRWFVDCVPVAQSGNELLLNDVQEDTSVFVTFTSGLASDLDLDGETDLYDVVLFAGKWLADSCCESIWCEGSDLNNDGIVNIYDWTVFTRNFQ